MDTSNLPSSRFPRNLQNSGTGEWHKIFSSGAISRTGSTRHPPPPSEHEQFILMLKNMYEWGLTGAKQHVNSTWIIRLSNVLFDGLMEEENVDDSDLLRKLLRAGVLGLQGMYNVYSYIKNPFSSAAKTIGSRLISGDLLPLLESVYPLVRAVVGSRPQRKGVPDAPGRGRSSSRKPKKPIAAPISDSSSSAAPDRANTNRKLPVRGKTPSANTGYDNVPSTTASSSVPAPTTRRRIPNKAPNDERSRELSPVRAFTRYEKGWITRRENQAKAKARAASSSSVPVIGTQRMGDYADEDRSRIKRGRGVQMTAPLVNYGSGVRRTRRGGARTIQGMAPILEFNEAADDPYVMRQKVQ